MRRGQDAVTAGNLDPNIDIAAGYVDGMYANIGAVIQRCSHSKIISIAVHPGTNSGNCCDIERGDLTPAQGPGWVAMRRRAGAAQVIAYCSLAVWQECINEFHAQGVPEPEWWIAAYPGNGPNLYPGSIGHQYADPGPVDENVFADFIASVDGGAGPAPTPVPTKPRRAHVQTILDKSTGIIWAVVPGLTAYPVADWESYQTEVFIGAYNPFYEVQNTILLCAFVMKAQAWDYENNKIQHLATN